MHKQKMLLWCFCSIGSIQCVKNLSVYDNFRDLFRTGLMEHDKGKKSADDWNSSDTEYLTQFFSPSKNSSSKIINIINNDHFAQDILVPVFRQYNKDIKNHHYKNIVDIFITTTRKYGENGGEDIFADAFELLGNSFDRTNFEQEFSNIPKISLISTEKLPLEDRAYDQFRTIFRTSILKKKELADRWNEDDVIDTRVTLSVLQSNLPKIINHQYFVQDILLPLFKQYDKEVTNENYKNIMKLFIDNVKKYGKNNGVAILRRTYTLLGNDFDKSSFEDFLILKSSNEELKKLALALKQIIV